MYNFAVGGVQFPPTALFNKTRRGCSTSNGRGVQLGRYIQLKELLKLVARNREELDSTLTDKQKETLEKFEDCMNEMHSITERDAFSYGFRLGVQLMAESFLLPLGEEE